MLDTILLCVGAFLPLIWGIAHLFPARAVVKGFGLVCSDDARIITMEWVIEGVALIFIGAVVAAVTSVDRASSAARAVYVVSVGVLIALAVVTLFTGFKISLVPFKLCPAIFLSSAVLILLGMLL